LQGLDYRLQAPGVAVLVEFLVETLEAFGMRSHSADIFLQDDLLRWCGTNHLGEPPQVSRAPIGPAGVTAILPAQKGFEPARGVFAIADGIFTGSGKLPDRVIVPLGDIDRGEILRARQPGEWHGVSAGGFDPIA
jgi:hypothetical protein